MDYIILRMKYAQLIFGDIYNKCTLANIDDLEDIITSITDELVNLGILAEDGNFNEVFEPLELVISNLEALSDKVNLLTSN